MKLGIILLALVGVALARPKSEGRVDYDGYKVYRVTPISHRQLKVLQGWHKSGKDGVDFWDAPKLHEHGDLQVEPGHVREVSNTLRGAGMKLETVWKDLGKAIKKEREENDQGILRAGGSFKFNKYHRIADINTWMDDLANRCPTGLSCSVQTIGQSYFNRDLKIIKISTGSGSGFGSGSGSDSGSGADSTKPGIWIDCGIHAREWISPATCVYIIHRFIDDFSRGYTRATAILNQYDWYFLPSANPDGYEYTWSDDRMWRKTRSPNTGSSCVGTDPNRNWEYQWMVAGASSNPCSWNYAGTQAFSESETTAMRDFINSVKPSLRAYISIHSYAQLILLPYGVSPAIPPDYNELERAAKAARDELRSMYGTVYRVGTVPALLYDGSGGSADWAKFTGIKYTYTYELRDTGSYGYILPADQILATAKETYASLQRLVEEMQP